MQDSLFFLPFSSWKTAWKSSTQMTKNDGVFVAFTDISSQKMRNQWGQKKEQQLVTLNYTLPCRIVGATNRTPACSIPGRIFKVIPPTKPSHSNRGTKVWDLPWAGNSSDTSFPASAPISSQYFKRKKAGWSTRIFLPRGNELGFTVAWNIFLYIFIYF